MYILYIQVDSVNVTYGHVGLWTVFDCHQPGALCGVRADGNRFSIHSQASGQLLNSCHQPADNLNEP